MKEPNDFTPTGRTPTGHTTTGRTPSAPPMQNIPLGTESARLIRSVLGPVLFPPVKLNADYATIERHLAAMVQA